MECLLQIRQSMKILDLSETLVFMLEIILVNLGKTNLL